MRQELKNEFSWSKTRDEAFRECLRRYFFQYYGYWNGWKEEADSRIRQIYILKNLQTRQMWAGDHVHQRIEALLNDMRRGAPPSTADEAVNATLEAMRTDFKESRAGLYRQNPKKACGLWEHEYAAGLPDTAWKENADHVAQCVRNFYASAAFEKIRSLPLASWLELENRQTFQLDGLKGYVQLDFAFRDGDRIIIYDWKTGRADTTSTDVQLGCYILYAVEKWKAAIDNITAFELNLASNKESSRQLNADQLETVRDYIRDSADEMQFPLSDPEKNLAQEEDFEFTENETACRRCNFLKVCPRFSAPQTP